MHGSKTLITTANGAQFEAIKYSRWLLLAAALLFGASLYQRVLHIDESWIGEQAYWAAKEGVVRSELFRGLMGAEIRQLVYHWLFVWQAAAVIKLAGWSIVGLKLISLSYLGLFVLISYQHLRCYFFSSAAACYLFYALLLTNALVVEYSYVFRPEIMLLCLGFGSWCFLHRSLHSSNAANLGSAATAGLLAGLAALTHLNGLIFMVAGAGLLLWRRRLSLLLVFGAVATAVFSIYFLDLLRAGSWPDYLRQLAPALKQPPGARWPAYLLHVLNEQKRFFHSPAESILTLLTGTAGLVLYKARYRNPHFSDVRLYLLLLMGALAYIAQGKTTKYLLLYMPYLCLVIALAFENLPPSRTWQHWLLTGLLAGYVLVHFGYTGYLIKQHQDQPAKNQQLAGQLVLYRHARIVAPLAFIFPEIDNFSIQGVTCYKLLMDAHQISTGEKGLFATAARFQRKLIILDDNSLKDLGVAKPVAGRLYGQYRYRYRFHDFYIYEHL